MKKPIFMLLLAMLFLSACEKEWQEIETNVPAVQNHDKKVKARLNNAHFEKPVDFENPKPNTAWTKQGYILDRGIFNWAKGIGRNNSGGISLEAAAGEPNDIAATQTIRLDPNKYYRLSAWVKTEQVMDGKGANICLYGTWIASDNLTGTHDWRQISFDFMPPASGEVTIACRLGYWAAVSTGKAYFDDLVIEEIPKFTELGQHIRLVLDQEDADAVSREAITSWIANLDQAYEKYAELMDAYPYNGETITILSVSTYPGGWAVAGNPILWYKPYIREELERIATTGSWSFGIMHELGHDFALENANRSWIWNEEMFANFRMYYVAEELHAPIHQGMLYIGNELKYYYKTDATDSYDKWIAQRIPHGHDGLMYTLIRIKDQIGWEPFIKTYSDLNASSVNPATHWERFNLFLDKLSHYAGQDVRASYLPGELEVIEQLLMQ